MRGLSDDLRFAARSLARRRGFGVAAIVTLALGIGANAAIFSVIDAVLLRPLPYQDPDRLLVVAGRRPGEFTEPGASFFEPWAEVAASLLLAGSGVAIPGGMNLGGDDAERVRAAAVTSGLFRTLGVHARVGRLFGPADLQVTRRVAVISERLWRRRFAADPAVVGRVLDLNGQSYAVLGVLPSRVQIPAAADIWIPTGSDRQIEEGNLEPMVIVRMRDGIAPALVRDALAQAAAARVEDPEELDEYVSAVNVRPLADTLAGTVRPVLFLVAACAAMVLLVASINVAGLLLIRATERDREFAVRMALGASRWRLGRLVLVESAVLSVAAAGVAIPVSTTIVAAASSLLPIGLHGAADVALDVRAFAAVALLTLVTAVLAGVVPAVSIRRRTWSAVRRGLATPDRVRSRMRGAFVVVQVAAALVLLAGATTVARKVVDVMTADLGVRGDGVVALRLTPSQASYPDAESIREYFDRVERELRRVPGVRAVGTTPHLPGGETSRVSGAGAVIEGATTPDGHFPTALALSASPEYFTAIGIDLLAGRSFTATDVEGAPPVALVGAAVAEDYGLSPGEVIGRRLQLTSSPSANFEIVGVVDDVLMFGAENNSVSAYYLPFAQIPARGSQRERYVAGQTALLIVQAAADPLQLVPALRAAVARIDPNVPAYDIRSFDEVRTTYLTERRFVMRLMLTFGTMAMLLAVLGLYAVLGHAVERRRREIGIRIALGASVGQVRRRTLFGGAGLAALGVGVGSVAAFGFWRVVSARIENIGTLDAGTVAILGAGLVLAAFGAAWLPAERATRVDPVHALRAE